MKILKPKLRILNLEKLKLSPQFQKILKKYKEQKLLLKKKKPENSLIERLRFQLEKNESDENYFLKELKIEKKIGEEMKNTYGIKAFNGRSDEDFQSIEKKVGNKTKLRKLSLLVHSPFFNPHKENTFNKLNDYYLIEKRKNCINLPLIFPKKNCISKLRKKVNPNNFSGLSESSLEKINNISIRDQSISYSNNSFSKNLNSCFSAQTILDSLDSIRNEYRSVSKRINCYQKSEKNIYDKANLKYRLLNNLFSKNKNF